MGGRGSKVTKKRTNVISSHLCIKDKFYEQIVIDVVVLFCIFCGAYLHIFKLNLA